MRYRLLFVPMLAIVCTLPSARAGEFVSPEGFTLTYPDDWKVASKEQFDKVSEMIKKIGRGADLGLVATILGPTSDGFAPNINVVLSKERLVLTAAGEEKMRQEIKAGFGNVGLGSGEIKTKHFQLDGHEALSLAYERDDPGTKKTFRTWTVNFPVKKGFCILTCVSLKSQWSEAGPIFKSIINNLKLDDAPASGDAPAK